jgi:hypothetical protein
MGPETKNDCAGESQQKFTGLDSTRGVGWWVSESVSQWENCLGSDVVGCYRAKLVAEAGDSSGPGRKENVRRWKPLSSRDSDDVTVDTGVCVCVCVCV